MTSVLKGETSRFTLSFLFSQGFGGSVIVPTLNGSLGVGVSFLRRFFDLGSPVASEHRRGSTRRGVWGYVGTLLRT